MLNYLQLPDLLPLLPPTTTLIHPDPDKLYEFTLTIKPEEGYWARGKFIFSVVVTEEYNFAVSYVFFGCYGVFFGCYGYFKSFYNLEIKRFLVARFLILLLP